MLKKTKLASAIALAVGGSAASVGIAQAGTALFPYIVESPTVTTIVSVMNTGYGWETSSGAEVLHYKYFYKDLVNLTPQYCDPIAIGDGNSNLCSCKEVDAFLPTSKYDIQTIDMGAVYGSTTKGVLFNDPSVNNDWEGGTNANQTYAMGAATGVEVHRAYLMVDNDNDGSDLNNNYDDEDSVTGEAMILEFETGSAWGYQAFADRHRMLDSDFEDYRSANPNQVALMPWDEITTKFTVTPIDEDMSFRGDNYAKVWLSVPDGISGYHSNAAIFDRDENPVSGSLYQEVVCVGAVKAADLLTDGARSFAPDGGWTNVYNSRHAPDSIPESDMLEDDHGRRGPRPAASLIKVEFGYNGTFNNEPLSGTFNNSIPLHPYKGKHKGYYKEIEVVPTLAE